MIGLDTNIVVRLVVGDDARQTAKAASFIREHCSMKNKGLISLIVLCELSWVLSATYSYSRRDIAASLWSLLNSEVFEIESYSQAMRAWNDYSEGRADYADYLIKAASLYAGADYVVTFDKRAGKEKGFLLLSGSAA